MRPAIAVEQLSKQYCLGESHADQSFREMVSAGFVSAWRKVRGLCRTGRRTIPSRNRQANGSARSILWALRDVSLEVRAGETVGVIGRNGAGKSTLLKILSRITEPTSGRALLRGRVGSLLEVGTGFHPELTGRENVFLSGAFLGMTRREIAAKFDAIVSFAEMEPFLDTPVKRYSSGMYMRLAFAVASHLEPEILIVDEVLAVGDTAFQNKCLGKMDKVRRSGRTVLFVSHNMTAVKSLCSRAVLLNGGKVVADGPVDDVVNAYYDAPETDTGERTIPDDVPRMSSGEARFRRVRLQDDAGQDVSSLFFGQPFRVAAECEVLTDVADGHFEVSISSADGIHVTYSTTIDGGLEPRHLKRGRHTIEARMEAFLLPGQYCIDLGVHHHNGATADFVQRTFHFTVLRVAQSGGDHYRWGRTRGYIRVPAVWHLQGPGTQG